MDFPSEEEQPEICNGVVVCDECLTLRKGFPLVQTTEAQRPTEEWRALLLISASLSLLLQVGGATSPNRRRPSCPHSGPRPCLAPASGDPICVSPCLLLFLTFSVLALRFWAHPEVTFHVGGFVCTCTRLFLDSPCLPQVQIHKPRFSLLFLPRLSSGPTSRVRV